MSLEMGPREKAVRASLEGRPASLWHNLPERPHASGSASSTFASFFNGARKGMITTNGHFSCGKAEAEWGFPEAWDQLVTAGLITYEIVESEVPGWKDVPWEITELGWQVREDELKWFHELMDAQRADMNERVEEMPEDERNQVIELLAKDVPNYEIREKTGLDGVLIHGVGDWLKKNRTNTEGVK